MQPRLRLWRCYAAKAALRRSQMVGFPARAVVRWLLLVCAAAVTAGVPSACPYADGTCLACRPRRAILSAAHTSPYGPGSLVDDLLAAYPLLPVHARAQAVALSGLAGAAEEAGGSFSILRAALDASSTRCAGNFTLGGGQTVFAATDRAWTALEGQLGRGASEMQHAPPPPLSHAADTQG